MVGPWMTRRDAVPLGKLIEQLQETLDEREQVIAAARMGIPGPYGFGHSAWESFDKRTL